MLSTVANLQLMPDLADEDAGALGQALAAADGAVKAWCKRDLEAADYTDYYSGNGQPSLPLRQRPVTALTGVYLDAGGYFGKGSGAFGATALLTEGKDFVLQRDADGGATSKCGLLVRLGGGTTGGQLDWPWEWRKGTLTARLPPVWPRGVGNIKVVYRAGYEAGAVPADLVQAVNQLAAWFVRNSPRGGVGLKSESYQGYQYVLDALVAGRPELGATLEVLSHYRELAL